MQQKVSLMMVLISRGPCKVELVLARHSNVDIGLNLLGVLESSQDSLIIQDQILTCETAMNTSKQQVNHRKPLKSW